MRKVLVFSIAVMISLGIMAQNAASKKRIIGASNKYQKVQIVNKMHASETATGHILPLKNPNNKNVQAISKTVIGSSYNIYTALVSQSAGVTANPDAGIIAMVHRSNISDPSGSGNIYVSFSTDGGLTWDSTTVMTYDGSTNGGRYPGVAIYNPNGNTTATNAFAVTTGPRLVSGGWGGNYFSSMQFDGTNNHTYVTSYTTDTAGGTGYLNQFARYYLQNRGDKFWVLGNANEDDGTQYTSFKTVINKGTWDATADTIIWTTYAHVPDYIINSSSGFPEGYSNPALVMADNGTDGYLVYIGRDGAAVDNLSFQPIIYKTTDGGANWTKEPAFDWSSISVLSTLANDLSPVGRPLFGIIKDITMDANGHVHFITYIHGAYSNNVDSLGYYAVYNLWNGIVCDIYQTDTAWDAFVVDTVWAHDPDENTTLIDPGTSDALTWDERFQMSTTPDRSKIFYAWMDTDSLLSQYNIYPDIHVKMYDVATASLKPTVNLTKGTAYDAFNYWMYLSDVTFDLNGSYQLHITTSDLNTDDIGKVKHWYINGAILDENGELNGVEENTLGSYVSMYPNPTADILNLSINANGDFNIVIYNMLGSVVASEAISVNGPTIKTINMEKLPTGIYMVEISNENGSMVEKVIKK